MQVLDGKVVLITGAFKGICAATALEMAMNGATVIVNYNENEKAAEAIQAKHFNYFLAVLCILRLFQIIFSS
jgi:NAD(P)-dependent dehydrogenase (short-subunit alcohol dehydrogenase family)